MDSESHIKKFAGNSIPPQFIPRFMIEFLKTFLDPQNDGTNVAAEIQPTKRTKKLSEILKMKITSSRSPADRNKLVKAMIEVHGVKLPPKSELAVKSYINALGVYLAFNEGYHQLQMERNEKMMAIRSSKMKDKKVKIAKLKSKIKKDHAMAVCAMRCCLLKDINLARETIRNLPCMENQHYQWIKDVIFTIFL